MKRALIFLLLAANAWATTAVTGSVKNLGTATVATNTYVRFWLRGCNGNQPRVSGSAVIAPSQGNVFYFDMTPNGSGNVSGTLYSNDVNVECGGQTGVTWYGVQWFNGGKPGPEIPAAALDGQTLNLDNFTPLSSNPVVPAPTGDNTYCRLDGGNCGFTGSITGKGAQFTSYNSVLMADEFPGSDMAAKANAGAATLTSGGTVVIPPGTWNVSTTLACQHNSVVFRGGGSHTTILNYTGSGTAIDMNAGFPMNGCELHDIGVTTNDAGAVGVKAGGLYQTLENVYVNGTSARALWITGNPGTTQQSFSTHLINVDLENFPAIGIQGDHAVDIYMDQVRSIAVQNSTTALPFVIETGVSGLFLSNTTTGYGLHNLWIKSSTGSATYGYDATPQFLFFTNFVGDGACGGDGWLFDSTLINNYLGAHFVNSWSASAGNCVSLTAGANAAHISGGSGLFIDTSHLIRSAGNGILFDSTTATNLTITNNEIESNNQDNNADQHGIYIKTATNTLGIIGNTVGNTVYGGYQRYGVKIGAAAVDNLRLVGNELTFNVTDGFLNLATGVTYPGTIVGNTPISVGNKMNGQSLTIGELDVSNESGGNVAAFGQISTTNPKQLQILNTPGSNTVSLQAVQQGVAYNQDLLIQPANGSSTRIGNAATTTYVVGALNIGGKCTGCYLVGATSSIGGSPLTAGNCASGTATVAGAVQGQVAVSSPSSGAMPSPLVIVTAAVTGTNTVTVQLCAVANVTPTATTYNVAVLP